MNALREKLITEIQHIPDNRLQEILNVIHFFRIGLDTAQENQPANNIREFAGAWADMDEELFADWNEEWQERRRQAFSQRSSR